MAEIDRVAQMGVEVAHHPNDGMGLIGAKVTVFYLAQTRHHVVDMTPILGQNKLLALRVIVLEIHSDIAVKTASGTPDGRHNGYFFVVSGFVIEKLVTLVAVLRPSQVTNKHHANITFFY